ncbi:hypothetical protein M8C21_025855 [Ambrosia artemisiifolia]|uniref:Translation elongation factor KOW-like domain-containing protein n=1 Tax=Ambrosia artemisiifolia TaxID=4212 RepID=A0AAD5BT65_AMBAR|nr:hypothetical protein M8C21_025855 [Ambrosia artemisiifolia]
MRAVIGAALSSKPKLSRLSRTLYSSSFSSTRAYSITTISTQSKPSIYSDDRCRPSSQLLSVPWSANQIRFAKARGSDVRPGNVIERKGKIYQVVKAQHSTQGRGGAIIQVELRDVDSGNKVNESTKKVLLDNGLRVEVPPHVITGLKLTLHGSIDVTAKAQYIRCRFGN